MNSKKVTFSDNLQTEIPSQTEIPLQVNHKVQQRECENFVVDMINNFTNHYKRVNGKKEDYTLLDGINFEDLTSTNAPLEKFYEEMLKFKVNESTQPEYIKIYDYTQRDSMKIVDELYGIVENGKAKYLSTSFFSLLIELTNLKNETMDKTINYDIISLK